MKVEQLKEAAKLKGWKVEEYVEYDFADVESGKYMKIGFSTGRGVWYWFSYYTKAGDACELMFEQRYSQNNGSIQKGWRTGFKAEEMIEAAVDKSFERVFTKQNW